MTQTFIPGKDAALEDSIARFQQKLLDLGFDIEEASWLNPVPHVWSVHIRDKACALCFTNGKGATKKAALASALGEYFERLSTNYFFADFWLGDTIANGPFVHYPNEKWFPLTEDDEVPEGLLDARLRAFYDPDDQLTASMLVDLQSGNDERGVCGLPFTRQSDGETVYIPMNIVGNLYVSNGMSAGNTRNEARVQGLSEVFERHIKNRIIAESISLPEIPADVLARRPDLQAAEMRLRATLAQSDATRASYLPGFNLTSSLGSSSTALRNVLNNPALSLGLGLALPFLNIGEMQRNLQTSRNNYELAVVNFRQALYKALAETENALSARQHVQQQWQFQQQAHVQATRADQLAEVRYRAGAISLKAWLDAQESRRSAALAEQDAALARLQNHVTLIQALGGSPALPDMDAAGGHQSTQTSGSLPGDAAQ